MIGYMSGTILETRETSLLLESGGIGYIIRTTPHNASRLKIGSKVAFWTHLVVREDALDLYGFSEKNELVFFELLITLSGIGPKSALNILRNADVETLSKAVASEDPGYLVKVSGLGKKMAEKIVTGLKDKLPEQEKTSTKAVREDIDVIEALKALGYAPEDARRVLKKLSETTSGTHNKIKEALKLLGTDETIS